VLNTTLVMATPPCWTGSLDMRSFGPISCLCLPLAVSVTCIPGAAVLRSGRQSTAVGRPTKCGAVPGGISKVRALEALEVVRIGSVGNPATIVVIVVIIGR